MNERIFKKPTGVKPVTPKELTQPEGFDLETERRKEVHDSQREDHEEKFEFHARPAPKDILEHPVVRQFLSDSLLSFSVQMEPSLVCSCMYSVIISYDFNHLFLIFIVLSCVTQQFIIIF